LISVSLVYCSARAVCQSMMQRRKGRIINVGSLSYFYPYMLLPYASEKAKVLFHSIGLAAELKEYNIQVCSYAPMRLVFLVG